MDILIATANSAKAREFREMLGADDFRWHDLGALGAFAPIEETGATFLENASLKAAGYAQQAKMWALADDSGLEVDALNGKPGVFSARWAQINNAGHGDADNNAFLLRQMLDVPNDKRTARFVCVFALADPTGRVVLTARDTIEGRLLYSPRGMAGFGYDPLFFVDDMGKTTAELEAGQKHQISHRGKALRRLREKMTRRFAAEFPEILPRHRS